MYGDNRDINWKIKKTKKYYPYIKSTVTAFAKRFHPPLKVLDVGARDGYETRLLAECGFDVIGTDIVEPYVDFAVKLGARVVWDDITDSRFGPSLFDVVYSRHTLHWVRSTSDALKECRRILVPDGHIWIIVPLQSKEEYEKHKKPIMAAMQYFPTTQDFADLVKAAGFQLEYAGLSKWRNIKPQDNDLLVIARKRED